MLPSASAGDEGPLNLRA